MKLVHAGVVLLNSTNPLSNIQCTNCIKGMRNEYSVMSDTLASFSGVGQGFRSWPEGQLF